MSLTVPQWITGTATTVSTAAFTANTTTKNTLVACITYASTSVHVATCTTTANTFVLAKAQAASSSTGGSSEIWYITNATGETTPTVTLTWSGTAPTTITIDLFELNGSSGYVNFDKASSAAARATAVSVTSFTPSANNEIVIACARCSGTMSTATLANTHLVSPAIRSEYTIQTTASAVSSVGTDSASTTYNDAVAASFIDQSFIVRQSGYVHNTTSQTTAAVALSSSVLAGSLIVVCVSNIQNPNTITNVRDNVDGAVNYTNGITQAGTGLAFANAIYYFANAAAGTMTVTATFNTAQTGYELWVYEVLGAATSSVNDGSGSGSDNTTASTTITSGSFTTTNANDILFGSAITSNTATAGETGWTDNIGPITGNASEYIIVSSTGSYAATWTQTPSGASVAVVYAFKAASSAVNLAGTVTGHAANSGALTVTRNLGGSVTGHAANSGALKVTRNLGGSVLGHGAISGALTVTRNLGGSVSGHSANSGSLTVTRNLSAICTGKAAISGSLTVGGGGSVHLSGTCTSRAVISGALTITRNFSGICTGNATISGSITGPPSPLLSPCLKILVTSQPSVGVVCVSGQPAVVATLPPSVGVICAPIQPNLIAQGLPSSLTVVAAQAPPLVSVAPSQIAVVTAVQASPTVVAAQTTPVVTITRC